MRSIDKTNSRTFGRRAFTLAELLIVVAIIAVLVGISIPIFTAQREKSAEAADIANMRAAKAAAVQVFYAGITDEDSAKAYGFKWWKGNSNDPANASAIYIADKGTFSNIATASLKEKDAYGQGTATDGGTEYYGYNSSLDYSKAVIQVTIYPNGAGQKILKNFDGGKYNSSEYYNAPCIIIEWRNTTDKYFVGAVGGSRGLGQIIFIDD